jgi:hypothetical protein
MVESIHSRTRTEYYPSNNVVSQDQEIDITLELFIKQMQFLHRSDTSLRHTYTLNPSNYRQNVVDDGWTVTNYNDVVWEEPGTCEGRATITREQYEDFAKGIGELQKAISALEKRGTELQLLSLQQQLEDLEKLKRETWSKIGDKTLNVIIETVLAVLSKGYPLLVGLQVGLELKELVEIAREFGVTIDISREIEKLQKIERATTPDRLKEARER